MIRSTLDRLSPVVGRVSIMYLSTCRPSGNRHVDHGSIEVSIATIDRHSIAGVITNDPLCLLTKRKLWNSPSSVYKYSFELFRPLSTTKSTENYLFTTMQVTTPSKTQVFLFRDEQFFFKTMQLRKCLAAWLQIRKAFKNTPIADKLTRQLDDFYSKHHNKSHLPQISNSLQPG